MHQKIRENTSDINVRDVLLSTIKISDWFLWATIRIDIITVSHVPFYLWKFIRYQYRIQSHFIDFSSNRFNKLALNKKSSINNQKLYKYSGGSKTSQRGAPTREGGRQPIIWPIFLKTCIKMICQWNINGSTRGSIGLKIVDPIHIRCIIAYDTVSDAILARA